MPKNPDEMAAAMLANLKEKTGKTLPQWLKIVRSSKLSKHGQIVKFLKTEHEMGHGFASLVAHRHLDGAAYDDSDSLVDAQYSGPKAELREIYTELVKRMKKFGKDLELSPCKTYVSLRRKKQFGLIQPSTRTRVDVGLCLGDAKPTERLEKAGSFNSMVSHRVRLSNVDDVDAELLGWLRRAFDQA